MSHLPFPIIGLFLLTVVAAFALLAFAVRGSRGVMLGSALWIVLQSAIAISGFYQITDTMPPRLALAAVPPLLVIAALFSTSNGRQLIDAMSLKWTILLHSIRILVEATLYWLFLFRQVPALMTFEGGNIDILAGLSAPVVWWAFSRNYIGRRGLVIWNSLALVSVLNALGRAMLSAPFRFEKLALDQPTVAILDFPFVLLPAFLVPAVLFCHFVIFRKMRSS